MGPFNTNSVDKDKQYLSFLFTFFFVFYFPRASGLVFSSNNGVKYPYPVPRNVHCYTKMGIFDFDWFSTTSKTSKSQKKQSVGKVLEEKPLSRQLTYPEQYPAIKSRFASTVKGDSTDAKAVRPLLAGTQLEFRPLKVSYRASLHGWSPEAFHQKVDNLGAAVVLATTQCGKILGGYNPKGWAGLGENRPSVASFLFVRNANEPPETAVKLCKIGGGGLAVVKDSREFGIYFGPESLVIPLKGTKTAQSKLGGYYELLPNGGRSLFSFSNFNKSQKAEKFNAGQLLEVIVLTGVYENGESIPYSGGVLDMTSG